MDFVEKHLIFYAFYYIRCAVEVCHALHDEYFAARMRGILVSI